MLTQHGAGVVSIDNIGLPSGLDFGWLILNLKRHQFHESGNHFGRAQNLKCLQFTTGASNVLVVVEIRSHLRILSKELHYRKTLIVESLVHIAATLTQHYFNLALGGFEGEHAAQHRADDRAYYACQRRHYRGINHAVLGVKPSVKVLISAHCPFGSTACKSV